MIELLLIGIVMFFLLLVGIGASILFFRQLRREQKVKDEGRPKSNVQSPTSDV